MEAREPLTINLQGVADEDYVKAVFHALVNWFFTTGEDFIIKVLGNKNNSNRILIITHGDVSQETTIEDFFKEYPEFLAAEKPKKITLGRTTHFVYSNDEELKMLLHIFHKVYPSSFPALHENEYYWVFLKETDTITVTVTDVAKEWRRLTQLVLGI
jgi:hypothetical protein